jgi:hypothetical protein
MTSAMAVTATGRAVPAAHLLLGLALLNAPGAVLALVGRCPPSHAAQRIAAVLGARHLAQGVWLAARPSASRPAAAVDLLHALTMAAWAVWVRPDRRAALASCASAMALGLAELAAGRTPHAARAEQSGAGIPRGRATGGAHVITD